MRRLIIGSNGQVGRHLQHCFSDVDTVCIGRNDLDLDKPETVQRVLESYRPDVILNAAAYTQVDLAEVDADAAYRVNRDAVFEMAQYASTHQALLVHYSTDYVFDGTKETPYSETDPTNPLSVYGDSKKHGDDAIQASGCQHFIFRTSWVFSERGKNFPNTILKLAHEREELKVIYNQYGAPTHAQDIACVTSRILDIYHASNQDERFSYNGIYNLTNLGSTSWHGFAKHLIDGAEIRGRQLKCKADNIEPVASKSYNSVARRPANSRLDCSKICKTFGLSLEFWFNSADKFLDVWNADD